MSTEKKTKNKIYVLVILGIIIFIMIFMLANRGTVESKIVGNWKSIDDEWCDANLSEVVTFTKNNEVEGIEGFNEYRIEDTDHDEYDYAVLSGGYEEATRYRIKINKDDTLSIVLEDKDVYDFDSAISCHMSKE